MLSVLYLKTNYQIQSHIDWFSPMFSSISFIVLLYMYLYDPNFAKFSKTICYAYKHFWGFFCIILSNLSSTICSKDCTFSVELFYPFVKDHLNMCCVGVFLGTLFCSIDLSNLSLIPHVLDYCRFIFGLEVK